MDQDCRPSEDKDPPCDCVLIKIFPSGETSQKHIELNPNDKKTPDIIDIQSNLLLNLETPPAKTTLLTATDMVPNDSAFIKDILIFYKAENLNNDYSKMDRINSVCHKPYVAPPVDKDETGDKEPSNTNVIAAHEFMCRRTDAGWQGNMTEFRQELLTLDAEPGLDYLKKHISDPPVIGRWLAANIGLLAYNGITVNKLQEGGSGDLWSIKKRLEPQGAAEHETSEGAAGRKKQKEDSEQNTYRIAENQNKKQPVFIHHCHPTIKKESEVFL